MVLIKDILASLSTLEKVELFKRLYEHIAGMGINGDTELAHINKDEGAILKMMGGAGTINEETGLIQYFGGSPPPPPAASSTVTQQATIPDEMKPYVTDVLTQAQALNKQRTEEGFQPYQGAQIAEFQPEQQQAQTGIAGLVGSGQQYFDKASALTEQAGQAPTAEAMQSYMSPYMQNVVDIQKREAMRQGDVAAQGQAYGATQVGAFGGSRDAIVQAEQQRNLATQLGDIQAKGSAAAYADAQQQYAAQQKNALAAGQQFGQMGSAVPGQAMKEFGALESVGAAKQQQEQQALNLAKQQFIQEQTFPEANLQQYSSIIRGYNLDPNTYKTAQTVTPAPSYMQQIAGLGMAGAGIAGAFSGFGKKEGGLVGLAKGGKVLRLQSGGDLKLKTDDELRKMLMESELPIPAVQEELSTRPSAAPLRGLSAVERLRKDEKMPQVVKDTTNTSLSGIASMLGKDVVGAADTVNTGVAKTAGSVYDLSGKATKYLTGVKSPSFQEATGVKPFGLSDIGDWFEGRKTSLKNEMKPSDSPTTQDTSVLMKPNLPGVGDKADAPLEVETSQQPAITSSYESPSSDALSQPAKSLLAKTNRNVVDTSKWDDMLANVGKNDDASTTELNNLRTDLALKLDEASEKKKGILGKRQEELGKQKWMALAEMGASVLAQPGGQTFLQSMGRGVKESGIIGTLAKIGDKASDIETDLAEMDTKAMMAKYGLKKDQIADIKDQKKLDIERMKAISEGKYREEMIGVYKDKNETDAEKAGLVARAAEQSLAARIESNRATQANRALVLENVQFKDDAKAAVDMQKLKDGDGLRYKEDIAEALQAVPPSKKQTIAYLNGLYNAAKPRPAEKKSIGGLIKPRGTAGEAI